MHAVIYAAKSTEDTKGSIQDQIKGCRELAAQRGWTVDDEYQDEAKSAFHGSRGDGLTAAMEHCERLAADGGAALIVQHSDRLARGNVKDAKHLIEYGLWAIKAGVTIVSEDDPGTFEDIGRDQYGLLKTYLTGERNHEDSRRKGEAVKRGQRRRVAERGRYKGGRRPYGYRYEPQLDANGNKDSRLVADPVEAAVVRRIFAEFVGGVAQNAIAKALRAEGVPTLTATEVAEGRHKSGPRASTSAEWHATTIKGILTNPLYAGRLTLNGEQFPAIGPDGQPTHEAIVDQETWQRACDLRSARHAEVRGGHKKAGRWAAGRHLLADGLLRCTCGAVMSPRTVRDHRGSGYVYEVYVCARKLHHGAGACPHGQPPIKRAAVDEEVYSFFERVALDQGGARKAFDVQVDRELAGLSALEQQSATELARAEARIVRITRGWQDLVIDDAEYTLQRRSLEEERDAARAQLQRHQERRNEIEQAVAQIDVVEAVANDLENLRRAITAQVREGGSVAAVRAALKRLFVGFELGGPNAPFGSGTLTGHVWQSWADDGSLALRDGLYLLAFVRPQAVQALYEEGVGMPALHREGLAALSPNLYSFLAA